MPQVFTLGGSPPTAAVLSLPRGETGVSAVAGVPCWGESGRNCLFATMDSGRLYSLAADAWTLIPTPGPVRSLAAGASWLVMGVQEPGTKASLLRALALGDNADGACGVRVSARVPAPTYCAAAPRIVTRVFAGTHHAAATTSSGGVAVWGGLRGRHGALPRAILFPASCWTGVDGDSAICVALCDTFAAVATACGCVYHAPLPLTADFDGTASSGGSSAAESASCARVAQVAVPGRVVQVVGSGGAAVVLTDSGHAYAWGSVPVAWLLPHQLAFLGVGIASRGFSRPLKELAADDGSDAFEGELVVRKKGGGCAASRAAATAGRSCDVVDVDPSAPVAVGQHAQWRHLFACPRVPVVEGDGATLAIDHVLGLSMACRVMPLAVASDVSFSPDAALIRASSLDLLGHYWTSMLGHTPSVALLLGTEDPLLSQLVSSAALTVYRRAADLGMCSYAVQDGAVFAACSTHLRLLLSCNCVSQFRSLLAEKSHATHGVIAAAIALIASPGSVEAPVLIDDAATAALDSGSTRSDSASVADVDHPGSLPDSLLDELLPLTRAAGAASAPGARVQLPVATLACLDAVGDAAPQASLDAAAADLASLSRWTIVLLQACHLYVLNERRSDLPVELAPELAVWVTLPLTPGGEAASSRAGLPLHRSDTPSNLVAPAPLNWFERCQETLVLCSLVYGAGWRDALATTLTICAGTAYAAALGRGTMTQQKRARARQRSQLVARRLGLALARTRRAAMIAAAAKLAPDSELCVHVDGAHGDACRVRLLCHEVILRARVPTLAPLPTVDAGIRRWCIRVPGVGRGVDAGIRRCLGAALLCFCYLGSTPVIFQASRSGVERAPSLLVTGGLDFEREVQSGEASHAQTRTQRQAAHAWGMLSLACSLSLSDLAGVAEQSLLELGSTLGTADAGVLGVLPPPACALRLQRWSTVRGMSADVVRVNVIAAGRASSDSSDSPRFVAAGAAVAYASVARSAAPWHRPRQAASLVSLNSPAHLGGSGTVRPSLSRVMQEQAASSAITANEAASSAAVTSAISAQHAADDPDPSFGEGTSHGIVLSAPTVIGIVRDTAWAPAHFATASVGDVASAVAIGAAGSSSYRYRPACAVAIAQQHAGGFPIRTDASDGNTDDDPTNPSEEIQRGNDEE